MSDLEYIKSFSKISITSACKHVGVNRSSLLSGKLKNKEKIIEVRKYLESEVAKLYIIGDNNEQKENTL